MKPLVGYCIIEPHVQQTEGGIIFERSTYTGHIVAVADKNCDGLNVGDYVRYHEVSARPLSIDKLLRSRASDIYYKIDKDGNISCHQNKVAILVDVSDRKETDSGLVVIDSTKKDVVEGVVFSCGPLCEDLTPNMVVGFMRAEATMIVHDKKTYAILREPQILYVKNTNS